MDDGNVFGIFNVYVGDVMIFAPPEWVMGTIRFIQSLWACNIGGTMMTHRQLRKDDVDNHQGVETTTYCGWMHCPDEFTSMLQTQLHFLVVTLEITKDGVLTTPYVVKKVVCSAQGLGFLNFTQG